MGKLKIKKSKTQRSLIPAPLNITGFTMEQASRQTGVRIESLKTYLDSKEQEIREQLIKESQEKLWKAEDYIAVANILISVIAIKKAWDSRKRTRISLIRLPKPKDMLRKLALKQHTRKLRKKWVCRLNLILLILIGSLDSEKTRGMVKK